MTCLNSVVDAQPAMAPLTFEEVPEVSKHALPLLFGHLKQRQLLGDASIGAFVVRDAGWGGFEQWLELISTKEADNGSDGPDPMKPGFISPWSGFHQDSEGMPIHPITGHYTEGASMRAMILEGSRPLEQLDGTPALAKLALPKTLFRRGGYNPRLVTPPRRALTTRIQSRDLLIFDHREPHAFQKIERMPRKTWANYVNDF